MHRAQRKSGVSDWGAHDLRSTGADWCARLGVSPWTIELLLGHGKLTGTGKSYRHYVQHKYDADRKEALNLWSKKLLEILGFKPVILEEDSQSEETENETNN